jgi:hypothetical protein
MNGLCECGCGQVTSIAPKTAKNENIAKWAHRRFCFGHQNRRFIKNHSTEPQRGHFIHSGYVYVIAPEGHPHPTNKRYIKRCRLVMEGVLERYLERKEQVRHKNMNRSDDRPENLEVMLLSDHNRLHRKIRRMIDGRK